MALLSFEIGLLILAAFFLGALLTTAALGREK